MVIDDEKHTIRAEDENKYKQTKSWKHKTPNSCSVGSIFDED